MSFTKKVKKADDIVPHFNVGALLDIPTGAPVSGLKGETIINGGVHHLTGQTGEANSAKTGVSLYQVLTVMERYPGVNLTIYDSENTLPKDRVLSQARHIAPSLIAINEDGDADLNNFALVTPSEYLGDEFYEEFKTYGEERPKLKADYVETPFFNKETKEVIKILNPEFAFIDSFSMFGTTATKNIQDNANIGETGQNMLYMKDGLVKAQMMNELPRIVGKNGLYFVMTAQIGENRSLDPYKAPRQQLGFLKNGLKIKKVPDDYRYLMHNLWFNFAMKPLINSSTKAPEYPRNSDENNAKGDSDLQEIVIINLRGKSGASGKPMSIVYSQSEGVKASLTEFHNAKEAKFGITNKQGKYTIDLYPDCNVGRTNIRQMLEEDYKLKTAVKLTSDLLQVKEEWRHLPANLVCDPKTLYDDIKALGYDWDVLLQTRSHWTYDQYTNPVPFLSIMDLLYMREGTYKPYWMENKNDKPKSNK